MKMYIAKGDWLPNVICNRQTAGIDLTATVDQGERQKFMSIPGTGPWISISR
jgi:hypothetical protein